MSRTVEQVVYDAMEHGSLLGHGYGKTLTLAGRRRWTIRVQSDVFGRLWSNAHATPNYPDLVVAIDAAIATWRDGQR